MGDVRVISTADALCVSPAVQLCAQKCVLWLKFLASLESPDGRSLLVAVVPLKSLISAEYTKVFRCPHSQKSRGLRSGDCAGQLTRPPRPIHCSPKAWFSMTHMCCHCWRDTCSKTTGNSYSNTSTVALRVVGGDEKGILESETVKYGRQSHGTRTREWLRWRGPTVIVNDRPLFSSERAPHINKPATVWQ
jgi:hypothetical protein